VQTFLPFADFETSARCLDRQRLGKQRVEAWQIVEILRGKPSNWVTHPCIEMWRGHVEELIWYGINMCIEWRDRGYEDNMLKRFEALPHQVGTPIPWLGRKDFHLSHQSNLLRKFPGHYVHWFPTVRTDLPYIWPDP
jgi:pyrimidine dimer DNA glycosylase